MYPCGVVATTVDLRYRMPSFSNHWDFPVRFQNFVSGCSGDTTSPTLTKKFSFTFIFLKRMFLHVVLELDYWGWWEIISWKTNCTFSGFGKWECQYFNDGAFETKTRVSSFSNFQLETKCHILLQSFWGMNQVKSQVWPRPSEFLFFLKVVSVAYDSEHEGESQISTHH